VRILIVDDSKAVHAFLEKCFENKGIQITHAYHGGEGIEILCRTQDFDLIMLDWEMPEVDGPTFFDRISEAGVKVPVLMMTTKNEPDDILFMLTKGAREYMLKPFTADIVFEKLAFVTGFEVKDAA
jgi:two-component system, chemotaxis family, chemotaxis protein CheY